MDFIFIPWANLIIRWFHIFVAILWVGQTYYFMWLDRQLAGEESAGKSDGSPARVWMVHSGGFYVVEKHKGLELLPGKLHWFKWEAALTWLSGMALLWLVYYRGGGLLVDTDVADIGVGTAAAIGLGTIVAAWLVYDFLWLSPLSRVEWLGVTLSFALVVGVAFGLTRVLSGRAAYMHVGAIFGTLMAANVWLRILPAQRQMVAAVKAGEQPDPALGARARFRSKHNSYLVVPLIFIMISSHFPVITYGHAYNWVVLSVLVLAGWGAARLIRMLPG